MSSRVLYSGYILKQGGMNKNSFKVRWFVLTEGTLSYYREKGAKAPIRKIDLHDSTVRSRNVSVKNMSQSSSNSKELDHAFDVITGSRIYYLSTKKREDKLKWMSLIRSQSKLHEENERILQLERKIILAEKSLAESELKVFLESDFEESKQWNHNSVLLPDVFYHEVVQNLQQSSTQNKKNVLFETINKQK
ncbi:dual adapter for phosphotyrosine and 3-phosphotyrosine and 3-phosphoinositide [Anaeramoeba flamelloides]|uniref:Dual adapter for phosphotyrosine and 3-phosphotyrosine and 3-phosphoinositide n=1 Tax=Anaeramoeba flamelloides TaxID=1746091 RepID=A0AAV8A4T5_9EUKA|nr:dual adapter for phosphotyrosine and 3-phosphotyrosine and 3-phosphoinositide [Anaeramoeba flamelloides]KAJ6230612.1 dual adapter for phosphotyrosine and 3-phosphotyrosine and 3-phosphoinositide [Anaeramoeba flamelloides]